MSQDEKITLLGHLKELRQRLIKVSIAVVITTSISFFFYERIFEWLKIPAGDINLIFIDMTEGLATVMKVCMVSGLIIAMPYLIYHLLMFILPALTSREKKMVFMVMPWITLMFAGGVAFGYYVLIPPATRFLLDFSGDIAEPQIRVGNYIGFVTRLLLSIGLVFETPVVTTFLARLGIIDSKWLAKKRRLAIIFAFVLAAVITPTFDPINQCFVAVPLIILYEMGVWLAKLVGKKKTASAAVSDETDIEASEG
jgi:sec-independent protein translocase protein TatC